MDLVKIGWDDKDRRGLFALEDFAIGEYILALPFSATFILQEKYIAEDDAADVDELESEVTQALVFLRNFATKPRWKPYVDALPRIDPSSQEGTPDFWSTSALEEFPVPLLRQRSKERYAAIQRWSTEYTVEVDELQWAVWILRTRGFTSLKNTHGKLRQQTMLLPLIDMINHHYHPNACVEVINAEVDEESFVALKASQRFSGENRSPFSMEQDLKKASKFWTNMVFFKQSRIPTTQGSIGTSLKRKDWHGPRRETCVVLLKGFVHFSIV